VIRWLLVFAFACGAPPKPPVATALPHDIAERYRGQVVVLDFWAGWCADCREQVPKLARLAAAFARDGLTVIGVNAGEKPDDAAAAARDFGITYPIQLDPDLVLSDRLGAASLPALVVVDRSGVIVHRARRLDAETLAVIRNLLGE
jgi:thiol-disulfide isomerase/thioredoxin